LILFQELKLSCFVRPEDLVLTFTSVVFIAISELFSVFHSSMLHRHRPLDSTVSADAESNAGQFQTLHWQPELIFKRTLMEKIWGFKSFFDALGE
jgi:hypothetical protein